MSRTLDQPRLTPQFCFNWTALRAFLRVSRAAVDDTINQHLNALATPGSQPFDPASTASRQPRPIGRRALPHEPCKDFKDKVLFPSWQSRSDVLDYCAGVATSPDANDPEHASREGEDARRREQLIDERLDPYSARHLPREGRGEALAALIRNERVVEDIVRARTWALVGERCDDLTPDSEHALNQWRKLKTIR